MVEREGVGDEIVHDMVRASGTRMVVTAGARVAAATGLAAFFAGGNVYDVAVSAALAETVTLPSKCGLAGDLVALVWEAGVAAPSALVSIGGAARGLQDAVISRGLPVTGGLSVGIPGAPAGYAQLAERGRLPLSRLVAPAAELATAGFAWPAVNERLTWASLDLLREQNPDGVVYLPDGRPIHAGERVRLPGLADVLAEFADRGAGLMDGPCGDAVAASVAEHGGVIERGELSSAEPRWTSAAGIELTDLCLWATPLPTHGPALLEAAAGFDRVAEPAALLRHVDDVVRRRAATVGDGQDGTSVVTATDAAGNAVVIVHSNSFPQYGSGIVVKPYGLVLSNRAGRGFTAERGHPNFPIPGRRPITTLHAWAARTADGVGFVGATPGGENQMRWNAQTLHALHGGETDPARLVCAPRWGRSGGEFMVEEGFGAAEREDLLRVAGTRPVPRWGMASAQQVVRLAGDSGLLVGAADPRTGATATGV